VSETIQTIHVPGHCPDALAVILGDEAILVGDNVLPEITPYPSREAFFTQVSQILKPQYTHADSVYGLRAYIRSLKKMKEVGKNNPDALILPAHRLFHNNQWHDIDLPSRVDEIISHHLIRCAEIMKILKKGPQTAGEIARVYFPSPLLTGMGRLMAENEIDSHCELLNAAGDVVLTAGNKYKATGNGNFTSLIQSLAPG